MKLWFVICLFHIAVMKVFDAKCWLADAVAMRGCCQHIKGCWGEPQHGYRLRTEAAQGWKSVRFEFLISAAACPRGQRHAQHTCALLGKQNKDAVSRYNDLIAPDITSF